MAVGGEGPKLVTAVIEDMTVGWQPFAPPFGAQWNPAGDVVYIMGAVFRRADGVRWHSGFQERRQAVRTISLSDQPPTGYSAAPNTEVARYIWQAVFTPTPTFNDRITVTILVTNLDIYVESFLLGGWERMTPIYGQGSAVFTAASTSVNISGGATLLTDHITPGQHIFNALAPEHLEIATVNAEQGVGAITTVTAASAGSPAPQSLNILRNFVPTGGTFEQQIFARLFNGDLYVAGNTVGGAEQPAVLKIKNIMTRTSAPVHTLPSPVTNYLCSNVVLESDGSPDSGDSIFQLRGINGLDVLQDGRVVILTQEPGDQLVASIADRISRLRYSSNLDQTLWSLPPGGFTDVVAGGSGVMTALGRLGRVSTIHYHDTVALGQPTGQADPPLAFDTTRAEIGSAFPRTNKLIGGREWFVGYDGSVYTFNGSTIELVTADFRFDRGGPDWNNTDVFKIRIDPNAWIDTLRQEYCFSVHDLSEASNLVGCVNYTTGQVRRERYDAVARIAAAADFFVGDFSALASGDRDDATRIAGTTVFHPGGAGPAADFLFKLRERQREDQLGTNVFAVRLETHPLDFGMPGVVKVIERVILWLSEDQQGGPFTDDFTITLGRDESGAFDAGSAVTRSITYAADEAVRPEHFEFDYNKSAESWRIQIRMTDGIFAGAIKKIAIRFSVLGESEALFNPVP